MNINSILNSSKNEENLYENIRYYISSIQDDPYKENEIIGQLININQLNIDKYIILFEIFEELRYNLSLESQNIISNYINLAEDNKQTIFLKRILIFYLYYCKSQDIFLSIRDKYNLTYRIDSMIEIFNNFN